MMMIATPVVMRTTESDGVCADQRELEIHKRANSNTPHAVVLHK